ncbi:MAG TPA: DinB family protein [Puia sp.]|nr:DinB family protein [Puia sp.]
MRKIEKPSEGEYAPYAIMYIGLLPDDGMVLKHLKNNFKVTKELILPLSEEKLLYRYAPGKWTIKEILAHIIDDERIYTYRALRFARNDKTELPGFEQDDYALHSGANDRKLKDIFKEYQAVRNATIEFFSGLDKKALTWSGVANKNIMSVRAAVYHIAGHELHHINLIKERYL